MYQQEQSTSSSELQSESLMEKERAKVANLVETVSSNFIEITNAAGEFFRTPYSKSALHKFFYKLKCLEEEWYAFCLKYARIEKENHCLAKECEREKEQKSFYKSRLKFMKSSEENISRLKSLYENVKSLSKPKITEKQVQTDYCHFKVDSLKEAKNTLNMIKEIVDKRENRYEETNIVIKELQMKIEELKFENCMLFGALKTKEECIFSVIEKDRYATEHVYKSHKSERKKSPTQHTYTGKTRSYDCTRQSVVSPRKIDQRRSAICRTPATECPKKYREVANPRKLTPFSPPYAKHKDREKYQSVPLKKRKSSGIKTIKVQESKPSSRANSVHSDLDNQLKTILSIRSMLTNTVPSKTSDPSMTTTIDDSPTRRNSSKADCREVEILKRIQKEIRKKQAAIKEKIDRFNKMMPL